MREMTGNLIAGIDLLAQKNPETICYSDAGGDHSRGTLKRESDRLSGFLRARFPGNGPIIVYGGLEFRMIVCFLACAKAGRPYIPIDKHTPAERISAIAEAAEQDAVLEAGAVPFPAPLDNIVTVAELDALLEDPDGDGAETEDREAEQEEALPPAPVSGDEPFYIIYTSGTTGGLKKAPKGVRVSHDNLQAFTRWILEDYGVEGGRSWLAQAPYSFDLSVMNLYPSLASGGRLVALPREITDDFTALFAALPAMDIHVWVSTPSFADICLMDDSFCGASMPGVRHFLFCGEELLRATAEKLLKRFPGAAVHNLYGPTETTVAVTHVKITEEILQREDRLPVGRAKPGVRIVIADDEQHPVSDGIQGEILITGTAVAGGYHRNPEATAAAFLEFNGSPAYRTGDAGLLKDGMLYFKGRLDFQVKLNGYRIELEDVDHALCRLPVVSAAAAVPQYRGVKVRQLVAFVVWASDSDEEGDGDLPGATPTGSGDRQSARQTGAGDREGRTGDREDARQTGSGDFQRAKQIRTLMREHVMDYMVPQKYIFVDRLPLTSNGKVDRKRLMQEVNP